MAEPKNLIVRWCWPKGKGGSGTWWNSSPMTRKAVEKLKPTLHRQHVEHGHIYVILKTKNGKSWQEQHHGE